MMAFGTPPFTEATMNDGYFSFIKLRPRNRDFFKFHPHTRALFRMNKIPESFQNLLLSMLMCDPGQRTQRVSELKDHDFFKDENNQELKDMEFGARRLMMHEAMVPC